MRRMPLVLVALLAACAAPRDDSSALRERLTPLQFAVTQRGDTEPPFRNAYWNNHDAGIYVDIVSGEPLFSSADKYDSGTGWPSFTRPLEPGNIVRKRGVSSTPVEVPAADGASHVVHVFDEVRSKHANSHLGHLFDDGPPPLGMRYCINSAALRFIPASELEAAGYGQYRVK